MSQIYLLTFKPVDKFFFGGEKTFGVGGNENYLIRSERFPQQTTVLGTIRKAILDHYHLIDINNNGKINDKNTAIQLIGEQSFHLNGSTDENDFGMIRRLSPIFLMKDKERYFPAPLDIDFTLETKKGEAIFVNSGGKKNNIPFLKGYDPKKGIDRKWISESGETVSENAIFKEQIQPGVWKGGKGEEDEEGYYKQYFLKLRDPWRFACYVELETDKVPQKLQSDYGRVFQSGLVNMGKERSPFYMEVITQTASETDLDTVYFPGKLPVQQPNSPWQKIIFLSDVFVDNSIYDQCFLGITETVDFRFIQTGVHQTRKYANLTLNKSKTDEARKSQKYNLIKRGSVLYVEPNKIGQILLQLNNKRFRQIGYNFYSIMNTSLTQPTPYQNL